MREGDGRHDVGHDDSHVDIDILDGGEVDVEASYFDETVGFFNFPVLKIFCSFHSKNILVFVLAINCK